MKPLNERDVAKVRLVPDLGRRFGVRDRAIIELLVCGIRPEQIRELNLENVIDDFSQMKTPEFQLKLSAAAKKYLRRYLDEGRPLALRNSHERALFITERHGKRIQRSHLENLRRRIVEVTKLKSPRILSRLAR